MLQLTTDTKKEKLLTIISCLSFAKHFLPIPSLIKQKWPLFVGPIFLIQAHISIQLIDGRSI